MSRPSLWRAVVSLGADPEVLSTIGQGRDFWAKLKLTELRQRWR